MRLLTQCPNCQSIYRLRAADLQAAAGVVECGDCGHQFNALACLADDTAAFRDAATAVSEENQDLSSDHERPAFTLLDSDEEAVGAATHERASPDSHAAAAKKDEQADAESIDHDILFTEPDVETSPLADALDADLPPPADIPEVLRDDFVALNATTGGATKKWWWFLALVLLLVLATQSAWLGRAAIMHAMPQTTSLFTSICDVFACQLSATAGGDQAIKLLARDVARSPRVSRHLAGERDSDQSRTPSNSLSADRTRLIWADRHYARRAPFRGQ